mmetsp:Transcript_46144/g.112803  ORF Transcript_46144/g.112803 Transcript_46144/m.112803 type:complete len:256 (-) Transcript_46144:1589-2356(-)
MDKIRWIKIFKVFSLSPWFDVVVVVGGGGGGGSADTRAVPVAASASCHLVVAIVYVMIMITVAANRIYGLFSASVLTTIALTITMVVMTATLLFLPTLRNASIARLAAVLATVAASTTPTTATTTFLDPILSVFASTPILVVLDTFVLLVPAAAATITRPASLLVAVAASTFLNTELALFVFVFVLVFVTAVAFALLVFYRAGALVTTSIIICIVASLCRRCFPRCWLYLSQQALGGKQSFLPGCRTVTVRRRSR